MLQLVPQQRILIACDPADFRKGIDGLCAICRQQLEQDPFSGALFLFRNRAGTGIKGIVYDGQGYWLFYKRFSKGRLKWWPKSEKAALTQLAAHELQVLIWNGNPESADMDPDWRKIL